MDIRMYACGFGDCFRLLNEDKCLYVDFGTCRFGRNSYREDIFNNVKSDFIYGADFLLTHYHEDHYNGVIYMMDKAQYKFSNVYVPDIWNIDNSVKVVSLHLYKDIIKGNITQDLSIIDFFKKICEINGIIRFIRRGWSIQDSNYVALWPDVDYINNSADLLFSKINIDILRSLNEIASELIDVVNLMTDDYNTNVLLNRFYVLIQRVREIHIDNDVNKKDSIIKLSNYGNDISIVFQNSENCDRNILFTGDFGRLKKLWKIIENNHDNIIEMHNEYDVIKVPHHGTRRYYHELKGKNYLIPNIYEPGSNSKWRIAEKYISDSYYNVGKVYYSEKNDYMYKCLKCKKNILLYGIDNYIDI